VTGPIRRIETRVEELHTEVGRPVDRTERRAVVGVVVPNPWHGRGYVDDLQPLVELVAPIVAREISQRLIDALGGIDSIEAFGKAAIVGLDGELEHGAALIHTPFFGDHLRAALDGTSIIAFADQRAAPGTAMPVPMWHKTASSTRSHYQTVELRIPGAPRADEIVIAGVAASGPRPNARIGDRTTDRRLTTTERTA
jgi:hypothetical protein